jgi:hypothetical protein
MIVGKGGGLLVSGVNQCAADGLASDAIYNGAADVAGEVSRLWYGLRLALLDIDRWKQNAQDEPAECTARTEPRSETAQR